MSTGGSACVLATTFCPFETPYPSSLAGSHCLHLHAGSPCWFSGASIRGNGPEDTALSRSGERMRVTSQQCTHPPTRVCTDTNNETVFQTSDAGSTHPHTHTPRPRCVRAQVKMVFEIVKQKGMTKLDKICKPVRSQRAGMDAVDLWCLVACHQ